MPPTAHAHRITRVYLLMEGLRALCYGMIFTASALYQINVVQLTPLQLVLVGTVLEAVYFVFQIPTGVVADVYSRRLSIIVGFIGTGLAFIVEGSVPTFAGVLAAMVIWGFSVTFIDGALEAWLIDEAGTAAAERAFFRSNQVEAVAGIAGIVLATLLGRAYGEALPIVLGGAGIVLTGLLLILIMPERNFKSQRGGSHKSLPAMAKTARDGISLLRSNRMLRLLTLISLINGLWSEGFDRLWGKHLIDTFALPAFNVPVIGTFAEVEWFGAIRIVSALLGITVSAWLSGRLAFDDNTRMARAAMLMTSALAGGILLFALAGNVWLALAGYLFAAMLRGPLGTARLAWVNRQISNDDSHVRATVLSMFSQADALGQVAGGPLVGAVANSSLRLALAITGLLLGLKLPLYRLSQRGGGARES